MIQDSAIYKIILYGLEFIGRYYSSYQAFVVDNDDPEKLGRVKIVIPIVDSIDKTGVWAYNKGTWGGKDYGFNLLPQNGDMVWVEFEHGDVRHPIWTFTSYGTDERPEEFDSPNKYGFKTPAGNIIIIDDTEELESILVKHSNSKEYIKLVKDKLTLEGVQIYLGVNGDEKAVMGETLKTKLETLLTHLESHTHTTNVGPSGPPINVTAFSTLRSQLAQILSDTVKIDR